MPSSLYASHDSCIALLYTYTTVYWYIPKNVEDTVHREVEIMQHLSGHPAVVTLKAVCGGCKSKVIVRWPSLLPILSLSLEQKLRRSWRRWQSQLGVVWSGHASVLRVLPVACVCARCRGVRMLCLL